MVDLDRDLVLRALLAVELRFLASAESPCPRAPGRARTGPPRFGARRGSRRAGPRAGAPARRRSRGSGAASRGRSSRVSRSFVKPRTPESGVRSSCETVLHEVRLQALALPELRVLLLQLVVRLLEARRHLVEAPSQLPDLARARLAEADREVAGREPALPLRLLRSPVVRLRERGRGRTGGSGSSSLRFPQRRVRSRASSSHPPIAYGCRSAHSRRRETFETRFASRRFGTCPPPWLPVGPPARFCLAIPSTGRA